MELILEAPAPPRPPADIAGLPADLRPGDPGRFTADCMAYDDDGTTRYASGYAGWLVERWNGWAVWECTRAVASAIIAGQDRLRAEFKRRLIEAGVPREEHGRRLDEACAGMRWERDALNVDYINDDGSRVLIKPNERGRYVLGWEWCWGEVDANLVDEIHRDG